MPYVNPALVVQALVAHVADTLTETLYDAADAQSIEQAPDAFTAYQMRTCEVQDGLAVLDTATCLITVDVFDVRCRTGGTETDIAVGDKLASIANAAAAYETWRGDYAVVRCDVTAMTVAHGDEVSDALAAQTSVTSGAVTFQVVVLL